MSNHMLEDTDVRGTLIIVGGHEDKDGDKDILSRFVSLAGDADGKIVLMTTASQKPEAARREYVDLFAQLGTKAENISTCDGREGDLDHIANCIDAVHGVFFVGGEPVRILHALRESVVAEALRERYKNGLIIAGTSAGALMMPEVVIMDGESRTHPTEDTIKPGPGMGLLRNLLLDVHFAERGRCGRMLSAIAKFPNCVGIGIDEDAALIYYKGCCDVIGTGSVFVFDPSSPDFQNLSHENDSDIALAGVKLHVLPSGFRFRIKSGTVQNVHRCAA